MADSVSSRVCAQLANKPTLQEIREEARDGCELCKIICRSISNHSSVEIATRSTSASMSHVGFEDGYINVSWANGQREHLQLFVTTGEPQTLSSATAEADAKHTTQTVLACLLLSFD